MTWLDPAGGLPVMSRGIVVRIEAGAFVNEHGTPVSVLKCNACGDVVTICPAVTNPGTWGDGCLADECPSYDLDRDIDTFFEPMADAGLIGRVESEAGR